MSICLSLYSARVTCDFCVQQLAGFVAELYMKVTPNWLDPEVFLFYIAVMFHSISYGYLLKQIFQGA